jgi:hypothetical protein
MRALLGRSLSGISPARQLTGKLEAAVFCRESLIIGNSPGQRLGWAS